MGSGLTSRKKRLNYSMPSYDLSTDEIKWRNFCIKKNIRISPRGIYKDRQNIWPEYFKICKFYYDKYTR